MHILIVFSERTIVIHQTYFSISPFLSHSIHYINIYENLFQSKFTSIIPNNYFLSIPILHLSTSIFFYFFVNLHSRLSFSISPFLSHIILHLSSRWQAVPIPALCQYRASTANPSAVLARYQAGYKFPPRPRWKSRIHASIYKRHSTAPVVNKEQCLYWTIVTGLRIGAVLAQYSPSPETKCRLTTDFGVIAVQNQPESKF